MAFHGVDLRDPQRVAFSTISSRCWYGRPVARVMPISQVRLTEA